MSRSKLKGPYINYNLLKKIKKYKNLNYKIITKSRSSIIIPLFLNNLIYTYNGLKYIPIYITKNLMNYKLGEFSFSRNFTSHKKNEKNQKKIKKK